MSKKPASILGKAFAYDDDLEPAVLDDAPPTGVNGAVTHAPVSSIDLSGKPRVILAIGLGATGKTMACRWMAERSLTREGAALASVDPVNRELPRFFAETIQPDTKEPGGIALWLERFLLQVLDAKQTAIIDMGGGDASLSKLFSEAPDLAERMEQQGVPLVAMYFVSGRPDDLTPLAQMSRIGFNPPATAIVMNHVRMRVGISHADEFRATTRHPVYQAAIARGAVPIRMPHFFAADAVRDRHIRFNEARDGIMPAGKAGRPLGLVDQSRTHNWLIQMEEAFEPIDRWLP